LIRSATRPVNAKPGDGDRALDEMRNAGCIIESFSGSSESEPIA